MFPSGPEVIPSGWLPAVGISNSAKLPLGVILPILFDSPSVNQRLPSGPVVIPRGELLNVGTVYSEIPNAALADCLPPLKIPSIGMSPVNTIRTAKDRIRRHLFDFRFFIQ